MINYLFAIVEVLDFVWTGIILILLGIVIIGSLYLFTQKCLRYILYRLRKRREPPWDSSEIPELLLKSIDSTESIIFKSEKIKHRKKVRFIQGGVVLSVFGLLSVMYVWLTTIGNYLLLTVLLICVVITPIAIRIFSRGNKIDTYFLLTDKKILLYTYSYKLKSPEIEKYYYDNSIGVIFRKRFFDKKGDHGTVDFVATHKFPKRISIRNVPEFEKMQLLIESVLYEYGSIKDNWTNFTDTLVPESV